ncbi:hypothetical protein Gohar_002681 [Gossypium harknessii]|uniref:Uncharacterized protein n=1 Tax=Gossypium harknessii TaxID=34285 RepID=A0A7J9HLJ5_9ROSI|nr:hypothetical protein [Gossypium harknessii]
MILETLKMIETKNPCNY